MFLRLRSSLKVDGSYLYNVDHLRLMNHSLGISKPDSATVFHGTPKLKSVEAGGWCVGCFIDAMRRGKR